TKIVVFSSSTLTNRELQAIIPELFWIIEDHSIAYYFLRDISISQAKTIYSEFDRVLERTTVSSAAALDEIVRNYPQTVRRMAETSMIRKSLRDSRDLVFSVAAILLMGLDNLINFFHYKGLEMMNILGLLVGLVLNQYWSLTPAMLAYSGV